jgi:hypothetical protein
MKRRTAFSRRARVPRGSPAGKPETRQFLMGRVNSLFPAAGVGARDGRSGPGGPGRLGGVWSLLRSGPAELRCRSRRGFFCAVGLQRQTDCDGAGANLVRFIEEDRKRIGGLRLKNARRDSMDRWPSIPANHAGRTSCPEAMRAGMAANLDLAAPLTYRWRQPHWRGP